MSKILNILQKNRTPLVFLITGLGCAFWYAKLTNPILTEISAHTRGLGYCALIFILLGIYIPLVRNKRVLMANLALVLLLIMGLEVTCFFLRGTPAAANKEFKLPDLPDSTISRQVGDVPFPERVNPSILIKDGDTVYNVINTIDRFSRRVTPDHDSLKSKYALFFGCSIAFGTGLNDNQTFPYQFQQQSGDFNSYNYAFVGHTANHMLARFQYQDLSAQVKEKDGAAFYVFFWDHIYRAIGSMNRYCTWMENAPYYTMDGDQLVRKKMFKDGRPILSSFYEQVYQYNTLNYFQIDFPLYLRRSHLELVAEIIRKSKEEYIRQFGNDHFYCVFYPNWVSGSAHDVKVFKECLTEKKIAYIDLTDFGYRQENTLGGDPHPNAETDSLLASLLLKRYRELAPSSR